MRIAIQAADLDHSRIDGTRVYIHNLLKHFGKLDLTSNFFIYHRGDFNPELAPPQFPNYRIKKIKSPFFWTQARFAAEIARDGADVLWMPMHNIPFFRRRKMKTVVTIHDLAFKYFPRYFTLKDRIKLNFLAGLAIQKSDKIIAVSESTKKDILKFYPETKEDKIKVIYHGFDRELFENESLIKNKNTVLSGFKILNSRFILYVGAIQPRKNLVNLIRAFEDVKKNNPDLKLVIAGEKAWLWQSVIDARENSLFRNDIILTGKLGFKETAVLYKSAALFVFPELYAGFGIPILEAMAAGTPVIAAANSSLPEAGGLAALYFQSEDRKDLAKKIRRVLDDEGLRKDMIARGKIQIKQFSWEKCACETLDFLKG